MMSKNNNNAALSGSLTLLLPLLIIAIVAVGLCAATLHYYQHQHLAPLQQQQQAQQKAAQIAGLVARHISDSQAQLALFSDRSDINQAFADNATARFRGYQALWLAGAELTLIDPQRPPRELSFNAQELLKETRPDNTPAPVLLAGQPARLLASQMTSNGQGVLLLERPLGPLQQQLQLLLGSNGQATISQGGQRTLSLGSAAANGVTAQSSQGNINVQLSLPAPSASLALPAALSAAAIVLILLSGIWVSRRLNQTLRQDAAELIRYSEELARQADVSPRNKFNFPLFSQVTRAQQKLASSLRQQGGNGSAKPAPPAPALTMQVEEPDGLLMMDEELPTCLFRGNEICGVVGDTLTSHSTYLLGRAIGSEAAEAGQQQLLVARDGRVSSEELHHALIKGLNESGQTVIDLGETPYPVFHYGLETLETQSGVYITGGHHAANHNGLKVVISGHVLYGERLLQLRQRVGKGAFREGKGNCSSRDISERYLQDIVADIVLAKPMTIAIDCGNSITGNLAPKLFSTLGCEVVPLYSEVDGKFPNHAPNPGNPDNLKALIATVKEQKLDLGLAFNGDGSGLVMVTASGELIWPDRLLMLFSRDLLSRTPGADIIFDVKCSRALPAIIRKQGGRPIMYKTGHALIREKMQDTGASLGGEMAGHIFFADRWFGFADGLYAAARLLEILSLQDDSSDQAFAALKTGMTTPTLSIPVAEERKQTLMDALIGRANEFAGGRPFTLDGLRVDFPEGWGLVRPANSRAALTVRMEGRDEQALQLMQERFRKQLHAVDSSLDLPF